VKKRRPPGIGGLLCNLTKNKMGTFMKKLYLLLTLAAITISGNVVAMNTDENTSENTSKKKSKMKQDGVENLLTFNFFKKQFILFAGLKLYNSGIDAALNENKTINKSYMREFIAGVFPNKIKIHNHIKKLSDNKLNDLYNRIVKEAMDLKKRDNSENANTEKLTSKK
jgi:hypothetical protein